MAALVVGNPNLGVGVDLEHGRDEVIRRGAAWPQGRRLAPPARPWARSAGSAACSAIARGSSAIAEVTAAGGTVSADAAASGTACAPASTSEVRATSVPSGGTGAAGSVDDARLDGWVGVCRAPSTCRPGPCRRGSCSPPWDRLPGPPTRFGDQSSGPRTAGPTICARAFFEDVALFQPVRRSPVRRARCSRALR